MPLSTNIKHFRLASGLTQEQLAERLDVTRSTVTQWETGWSSPKIGRIVELAQAFDIDPARLMFDKTPPPGAIRARAVDTVPVPVYGVIAAGEPIEMIEAIDEMEVPVSRIGGHTEYYFLVVRGDSMNNEILDGSYVLIDPNAEVHNGDTVAVNVNGDDATLKIWHKTANSVILSPNSTNPEHKDLVIDETSPDAPNLRVLGKKVWAMYPEG
ncbi:MAG: helix-turn-helix domain-containing protein [Coriobacteriales bacterium]|nr:helix-turn-helix domain-containing protein [Coriobacteriales bacterium]